HSGTFVIGQTGGTFTITVTNVGTISTAGGILQVTDGPPNGLGSNGVVTAPGWSCPVASSGFACQRDVGVLPPRNSFPPITIPVVVGSSAPASVTNKAQLGNLALANPAHSIATDVVAISGFFVVPTNDATVTAGSSATFVFNANVAANAGTITFQANNLPP